MQALLDAGLSVVAVASNAPGVAALDRADRAGIATAVFLLDDYESREERDLAMADWLASRDVQLVICAGYMQLLTPGFLRRFPALNVHPSLLPRFPGAHAVEEALAAGVSETGATVHVVDEGVDTGRIVFQEPVPILDGDTVETLHARIQEVEHRLLPAAARLWLAGDLG